MSSDFIIPVSAGEMYDHRLRCIFGLNPKTEHGFIKSSSNQITWGLGYSEKCIFLIGGFLRNICYTTGALSNST